MIIGGERDVTRAVLAEIERAKDPRLRDVLTAAVSHLHAFIRDVKLTETEFQQTCAMIARLGHATTASHNEVVLMAGSLGVSSLVCLLNNGAGGETETTANLLGPFWRMDSPKMPNGGSLLRSPTSGVPLFAEIFVKDLQGRPVAGAEIDVWHSSDEGFYENQDPDQAEMNLRGTFTTDADGRIAFRSVKPAGYPIPVAGPVGELVRTLGRHNMRPAHIHCLIYKPGFKTQCAQVYSSDDDHLETDVQFGVTPALIGRYQFHEREPAPAADVTGPWYSLEHRLTIEPGEARRPKPPVTAKAEGQRPVLTKLERRED